MALWLFKQEPDCYSYSDLERDGETMWDGVSNALARKHLRTVAVGDRIWFYHTGKEKAVVGEMIATGEPMIDPTSDDPKSVVLKVAPVQKLAKVVTLAAIKKDEMLKACDLVRLPRLSVMPLTPEQWQRIEQLSGGSGKS